MINYKDLYKNRDMESLSFPHEELEIDEMFHVKKNQIDKFDFHHELLANKCDFIFIFILPLM